jgi:HCOMODA/2-hydroxy-3-carboxy-muconic semialdehyde decarboxylase
MATADSPTSTISSVASDRGNKAPAPDRELLDDLVIANRILFDQGVVDAFGHVSARHDKAPDRFLLARNMAPGQVTHADIIEFDLDGNPIDADGRRVYLERFIHGEIYRARPDVRAVVHNHSPTVVPFSIVPTQPFRPVCHMCGFIGGGAKNFEIREVAGDTSDLLIRSRELGTALARTLGSGLIALMRGHGATIVAESIPQVVYRAVYAEVNARLLAEALRLGPVTYLTEGEAESARINVESQVQRPWNLWKARVAADVRLGSTKSSDFSA